ncbi:MAG: hypothetical protein KDD45_06100, partial [Bdellovibrionales bacterium]|nr:hypothetical protein [Bdellovibrionales bacterium]
MKNYQKLKMILSVLIFGLLSVAATPQEKEWTFLLFLNANNNLDYFGDINLKQMEQIGSSDKINIVVQWGSMSRQTVKRLLIKKSTNPNQITSPVVEDIGKADMGDYKELTKFLKWGHDKYPAKKYFVAIWNHGNGWYKSKQDQNMHINDISYDDKTGNQITTEQLGVAMEEFSNYIGHKVDLYGSDACLMSMAEVAGEMSDSVSYFAGSQEVEPGYGWPYNTFLEEWMKNPMASPEEVGKTLASEYYKAYSGGVYGVSSVTFSILNLNAFRNFEMAVTNLKDELMNLSQSDMKLALDKVKGTQSFTYPDYKDFGQFVDSVNADKIISEKIDSNFNKSLQDLVVMNKTSDTYRNAHGISI